MANLQEGKSDRLESLMSLAPRRIHISADPPFEGGGLMLLGHENCDESTEDTPLSCCKITNCKPGIWTSRRRKLASGRCEFIFYWVAPGTIDLNQSVDDWKRDEEETREKDSMVKLSQIVPKGTRWRRTRDYLDSGGILNILSTEYMTPEAARSIIYGDSKAERELNYGQYLETLTLAFSRRKANNEMFTLGGISCGQGAVGRGRLNTALAEEKGQVIGVRVYSRQGDSNEPEEGVMYEDGFTSADDDDDYLAWQGDTAFYPRQVSALAVPTASPSPSTTSFKPFPFTLLPREIQLDIWYLAVYAYPTRVIELRNTQYRGSPLPPFHPYGTAVVRVKPESPAADTTPHRVPPLLHVCANARRVALQRWDLVFGRVPDPGTGKVFFDLENDVLFFGAWFDSVNHFISSSCPSAAIRARLRSVAFYPPSLEPKDYRGRPKLEIGVENFGPSPAAVAAGIRRNFPGLQTVYFLWGRRGNLPEEWANLRRHPGEIDSAWNLPWKGFCEDPQATEVRLFPETAIGGESGRRMAQYQDSWIPVFKREWEDGAGALQGDGIMQTHVPPRMVNVAYEYYRPEEVVYIENECINL